MVVVGPLPGEEVRMLAVGDVVQTFLPWILDTQTKRKRRNVDLEVEVLFLHLDLERARVRSRLLGIT